MAGFFKICSPVPVSETIDYLEDLLARARNGEIQAFGIVVQKSNGGTANGWTGFGTNPMSIIGELEAMKVDLIRAKVGQRYDCCGEDIIET